ncbi:MAG TPA: hypothetical protein VMW83_05380 [Spirochaetia bacterium]|nr:hypothetical protein [Spirochaetia bacterium]
MPEMTEDNLAPCPNRKLFPVALELFLLHSLVFVMAVLWGGTLLPENFHGQFFQTFSNPFTRGLHNFDAGWYLKIATHGYTRLSIVFFPLFPLLIRGLDRILPLAPLAAGLLLANLSFLAAIYLFLLLLREDGFPDDTARRAALFLALFPTGLFFSAVYTESLFLALTLAAFLCARRQQWLAACLLAGLTALTRNPGILLLPALGWEYLAQKKERGERLDVQVLYLALVPVLFATFLLYQKVHFGDPLAFVHTDSVATWGRLTTVPGWPIVLTLKDLVHPHFVYWWTAQLDDFLFAIFAFILLVLGAKSLRQSYLLYGALSFLMPLSTYIKYEPLTSMPRYIIVLFPLYIVLAQKARTSRAQLFLVVLFSSLLLLFTVLYINTYWVA